MTAGGADGVCCYVVLAFDFHVAAAVFAFSFIHSDNSTFLGMEKRRRAISSIWTGSGKEEGTSIDSLTTTPTRKKGPGKNAKRKLSKAPISYKDRTR